MGGHQPETSYRFSLSLLRRADACLWHVPNPPKDGAYAAECPVHCPLRGTPLPVSLLSENGYGTQSVQMSWNENHQTGLCVDSIAARQGLTIAGVQKITGIHWNTIRQVEGKANRRSGKPRQMPGEGDDDTWLGGGSPRRRLFPHQKRNIHESACPHRILKLRN